MISTVLQKDFEKVLSLFLGTGKRKPRGSLWQWQRAAPGAVSWAVQQVDPGWGAGTQDF